MMRDQIASALFDTAAYARPKLIRLGVNAVRELIRTARPEDMEMSFSVHERHRFLGVPFKQFSPLTMDPDSWEIEPGHCEVCEGRGFHYKPLGYGPERVEELEAVVRGNPFRGDTCATCGGKPLEPIKGTIH